MTTVFQAIFFVVALGAYGLLALALILRLLRRLLPPGRQAANKQESSGHPKEDRVKNGRPTCRVLESHQKYVSKFPLPAQVKLLRALHKKEIVRLGATRNIKVDVRMIAATNRDLKSMIAEGRFRQDLYYSISTFEIQVAPLRERRADIPSLANHFLAKLSRLACHPLPMTIEEMR